MPETKANAKLLERIKKCFKLASQSEAAQRAREREDLMFQIPELQWDDESRRQRQGGVIGGQAVPPRPMLSISLLTQPLQLIANQAANAHLGVNVHPVSESADKELAEIKQGLYRRIERDSNADQARLWALGRAMQCGRGWYRVGTKYDEDADNEFDQEIIIERIFDQAMVWIDPAAQLADFSDARWGIVAAWIPIETFEAEYPGKQAPANDSDFKAWLGSDPEWVMGEGEKRAVLVAEYFYKVYSTEKVTVDTRTRDREKVTVSWAKATSREILEEQDWNGKYIPLIPVIGRELQPFDGERRWEGIVRPTRDGQRFFNFSVTSMAERMALEPKAPFIGAAGQFEGHEDVWQQANTRNFPYLEYKPTSLDGSLNPPPARAQLDSTGMSLALMAMRESKQLVQIGTSVFEPSLGQLPEGREKQSGRAIIALQGQSDAGTGHFLQNLAKVSMAYEARVILDLMPAIYDRPGRVTQILGAEDDARMVMLGAPYVEDEDGRPQPAPMYPGMPPPAGVKQYDLSQGKYAISVSVGKSYQTRLQEGQSEVGEVLQAQPDMMPLIGATYFRFRDFPGAQEIADILKKVRDKQFPGLGDEKGAGPSAEQLGSQLSQAQQQLQVLQQQLQQAMRELETEKAKAEATVQRSVIDAQSTADKARVDAASAEQVARIKQETEMAIAELRAKFDALQAQLDREHAMTTQRMGAAHDAGMAAMAPPDLAFRGEADEPLDQGA